MTVEISESNQVRCLCPTCPTYGDCMRGAGERLYCAAGKSSCDVRCSGSCLCNDCPVWAEYGLGTRYFCVSGTPS